MPPLLELQAISKSFPGVQALRGADLAVERGEVHALLGGNGAGKSTLVGVIAGNHRPDEGTIRIDGRPVRFAGPRDSLAQGIAIIYQELTLVPTLSVAENVFLGRLPRTAPGRVDWGALRRRTRAVLDQLGLAIDPDAQVGDLATGARQQVEIARAVAAEPKLLIMDEPTSALTEHEVEHLFALLRRLKAGGVTIIYISHHLDEIYAISDRMTVMRDGRKVLTRRTAEVSSAELAEAMVGHAVERPAAGRRRRGDRDLLVLDGLSTDAVEDVSLTVAAGEVLGVAGALGAGRTELLAAIFGVDPPRRGRILLDGRPVRLDSPAAAIAEGVYLVPEDRKGEGLVLDMSVADNVTLPYLGSLGTWGVVSRRRQAAVAGRYIGRLSIRTPGPQQRIGNLSGGNQQKAILARWMSMSPRVLLLDQPMRGLDVGAKEDVTALVRALSAEGVAVIFVATELNELLQSCDRIVVMREGRIVRTFDDVAGVTEHELLLASIEDADPPTAWASAAPAGR